MWVFKISYIISMVFGESKISMNSETFLISLNFEWNFRILPISIRFQGFNASRWDNFKRRFNVISTRCNAFSTFQTELTITKKFQDFKYIWYYWNFKWILMWFQRSSCDFKISMRIHNYNEFVILMIFQDFS